MIFIEDLSKGKFLKSVTTGNVICILQENSKDLKKYFLDWYSFSNAYSSMIIMKTFICNNFVESQNRYR